MIAPSYAPEYPKNILNSYERHINRILSVCQRLENAVSTLTDVANNDVE